MISAGHLDPSAAARPGKLLGCGDKQSTDAALAMRAIDDKARDAPEKGVRMKERDTMKGENADNTGHELGDEDGGVGRCSAIRDTPFYVRDWGRITEGSQEIGYGRSVVDPGGT